MARESLKARERKRERLVAKYAKKRAELKAAGDFEALDKLLRIHLLLDCTIDANLLVVLKDT
jgi:hypothetical protein